MESKNITLKVNSELYDKYREICNKQEGWIESRQFEKCMKEPKKILQVTQSIRSYLQFHQQ